MSGRFTLVLLYIKRSLGLSLSQLYFLCFQHFHIHILPRKPGDFSENDDIYMVVSILFKECFLQKTAETQLIGKLTQLLVGWAYCHC